MQVEEFIQKQEEKKFEPEVLTRSTINIINCGFYSSSK